MVNDVSTDNKKSEFSSLYIAGNCMYFTVSGKSKLGTLSPPLIMYTSKYLLKPLASSSALTKCPMP